MSFTEKALTFVTGKNKLERAQERAANSNIKKIQQAAYYKERERQQILVAQAKARAEAKTQLRKINNSYKPRQAYSSPITGGSFVDAFGMGSFGKRTKKKFRVI